MAALYNGRETYICFAAVVKRRHPYAVPRLAFSKTGESYVMLRPWKAPFLRGWVIDLHTHGIKGVDPLSRALGDAEDRRGPGACGCVGHCAVGLPRTNGSDARPIAAVTEAMDRQGAVLAPTGSGPVSTPRQRSWESISRSVSQSREERCPRSLFIPRPPGTDFSKAC